MDYPKMKEIDSFEVQSFVRIKYLKWNKQENKMEFSPEPKEGFKAAYEFMIGPDAQLSASEAEMKLMLLSVFREGKADIVGRSFKVEHQAKTVQFSDGEKEIINNLITADEAQEEQLEV
jgi:hypothetical protein